MRPTEVVLACHKTVGGNRSATYIIYLHIPHIYIYLIYAYVSLCHTYIRYLYIYIYIYMIYIVLSIIYVFHIRPCLLG